MLYLAYGMNTNIDQMASRCPGSISIGRVDIPDYRLVFRGVADVEESYGDVLQTVMWDITPSCEAALDILEGYPHFYTKVYLDVTFGRKTYQAMMYKMVGERLDYSHPSYGYQHMLEEGYQDHGLDLEQIYNAQGFINYDDTLDWINKRYERSY
jgi:hypothetical protein